MNLKQHLNGPSRMTNPTTIDMSPPKIQRTINIRQFEPVKDESVSV